MLWITLIVASLIAAAAFLFVVWPLLQTEDEPVWVDDDRLNDLLSRKDTTLRAIKELEFDYQVGKVSEEDYARFEQRLRRQAIGYIRQIERLTPYTAALEDELEAQIARLRRTTDSGAQATAPDSSADGVEAAAAANSSAASSGAGSVPAAAGEGARFCTECGKPATATQRFCGHCGTRLAAPQEASEEAPVAQEG